MNSRATDIIAAILLIAFIYSLAVTFTLNFSPLYYIYVQASGLPARVGIPMDEIMDNYRALIAYNSVLHTGALSFPTLELSEHGRIHYEEVRRIFAGFQICLIASAAGCVAAARLKIILPQRRAAVAQAGGGSPHTGVGGGTGRPDAAAMEAGGARPWFLRAGGIASLVFAAAVLLCVGFGWQRFFVGFHEIVFGNDYWIFDSEADPSILILPDGYFRACAVMIFALVIAMSLGAMRLARSVGGGG
jgi:uncharacterized membrane protein